MAAVPAPRRIIGSYELDAVIAVGGMASVHVGRSLGPHGSQRIVAIKRLHDHLAGDPAFGGVLLQEARITQRIDHPNVVATLDVVALPSELLLVMEYVHGETVARLMRAASARGERCDVRIAASIARDALRGLAAAHATSGEDGAPLGIVHRDVSPQNLLVTTTGITRVLDFGIAKMVGSQIQTRTGNVKGKVPYMAPEVLELQAATPQADVWGLAVVLWEMLAGRRLFSADTEIGVWSQVLKAEIVPPGEILDAPTPLDAVVMRGLERDPARRFRTADEMASAIEAAVEPAPRESVATWVRALAAESLAERERLVDRFEGTLVMTPPRAVQYTEPLRDVSSAVVPRRRKSAAALGAIGVVAALAASAAWLKIRPAPPLAAAASTSAPVLVTPEPSLSVAQAAAPPPVTPPSASSALPSKPERAPSPKPRPIRSAPPPRKAAACDPPYSVDADGHKIFKLECVK